MKSQNNFESFLVKQLRSFQASICDIHDIELRKLNAEKSRLEHHVEIIERQKEQLAERLVLFDPDSASTFDNGGDWTNASKDSVEVCTRMANDIVINVSHIVALGETWSLGQTSPIGTKSAKLVELEGCDPAEDSCSEDEVLLNRWSQMLSGLMLMDMTKAGPAGDGEVSLYVANLMQREQDIGTLQESGVLAHFISYPASLKRVAWELFGLTLVLYDVGSFPFTMAFDVAPTTWMTAIEHGILAYWICDLISRFFVGYYDKNGLLEMRLHQTAKKYFRGSFSFDFLVVIVDLAFTIQSADSQLARATRIVKFTKVGRIARAFRAVRVLRIAKYRAIIDQYISAAASELSMVIMEFIRLVALVMAVNHILACLWWALGNSGLDDVRNWIDSNDIENRSLLYRYLTSLHWAITQFTPASMEVIPKNSYERAFAICTVIFGMVAFSSCISSITSLTMRLRNFGGAEKEREAQFRMFLKDHHISFRLTQQLWNFLNSNKAARKVRKNENSVVLLDALPDALLIELKTEMYLPSLVKHPFFHRLTLQDPHTMQQLCSKALTHSNVGMGQQCFEKGSTAEGMLFLSSGSMLYSLLRLDFDINQPRAGAGGSLSAVRWATTKTASSQSLPCAHMAEEGSWISEAALWIPKWVHCGWLVALRVCEVFELSTDNFHDFYSANKVRSSTAMFRYGAYFHHLMCEVGIWRYDGITDVTPDRSQVSEMAKKSFDAPSSFPQSLSGNRLPGVRVVDLWHLAKKTRMPLNESVPGSLSSIATSGANSGASSSR